MEINSTVALYSEYPAIEMKIKSAGSTIADIF